MEFSLTHVLILLVIALLVFGARRIPEIGSSLGQGIREFKKSLKEMGSDQPPQPPVPPPAGGASSLPPPPSGGEPKRLSQ
jgi:sec-independent protein translocase protein TatA